MLTGPVRVRFAPSPTGFMHLGNVRAAVINYLFAKQNNGSFILRIEDTDAERNVDQRGQQILADLAWLGLQFDEGPLVEGPYKPYYQSERSHFYKEYLEKLIEQGKVYRCFCTTEELERKRQRQIASKMPPRYDRTCAKLSQQEVADKLKSTTPFIWRFKLDQGMVTISDLARGSVTFDFKNFSDFPLTRADGSFTFIFANFVDDLTMKITHVFRGEDHLTNTAVQAALYMAFDSKLPVFWHLPLMCNAEGKKLSKRDFGFSLNDLRNAGYLAEAICNYLATIGLSLEREIMDLPTMIESIDFSAMASTGQVRYDLQKLRWMNHKWISQLSPHALTEKIFPLLLEAYPDAHLSFEKAQEIIKPLQGDLVTLNDAVDAVAFLFTQPNPAQELLESYNYQAHKKFLADIAHLITKTTVKTWAHDVVTEATRLAKEQKLPMKELFSLLRIVLTGKATGPSLKDILSLLGKEESTKRLS